MSKVYKWLALILGVLVLLVVGITLFVKFYLTGDLLIAWIKPPLEHYLHRDVTISDAKIGLRGFRVEGLEIRKQGASTPLLKGKELELRWKFKELFKGRIVIQTLNFSSPEITLIRYADGSLNAADLLPQNSASETAEPSGKSARNEPPGVPFLISLLSMENGRLTLIDDSRRPQASLQAANMRLRLNDLSTTAPVPFEVEGQIHGENNGSFTINGTLDMEKNIIKVNFDFQGVDLAILNPFFGNGPPEVIQQGILSLDASLTVEQFDHLKGKGSCNFNGLQIMQGKEFSKVMELSAGFQLDAVISQQTLTIDALDLTLNGQKAKIQGLLTQWQQRPQLNFTFSSPEIKLDELLTLLPKGARSSGAADKLVGQGEIQKESVTENPKAEPGSESPLASSSDAPENQSEQTGEDVQKASSSAAATDQPATTVGEPVATARKTEAQPQSSPSSPGPKPMPLDAQGEIHLDWLFYNKLVVSNVACQLKLQDGKLQLKPLSASIYGGGLKATVNASVGSLGPPFECRIYSENVLLDEIIGAFWPKTIGSWSGNVNHISRAKGIGSDLKAIEFHTDLNINEAEFSGHPLLLKLAELFQTEDLQQLRFSQVTARIITSKGIARIKRLHLVGPILQVEGGGTAGLIDKKLNLNLHLQIQPAYVGKLAALREIVPKISDAEGFVQLPLNLGGTFNEPVYTIDEGWLAKLPKEEAKEPVKKTEEAPPPASALGEKDRVQVEEGPQKNAQ